MCNKDGVVSLFGSVTKICVKVVTTNDAQARALEKFIQATPVGRTRMLVEAEAQSRRESVIVMDGE